MSKAFAILLSAGLCLSSNAGAEVRISTVAYSQQGLPVSVDAPRVDVADVTRFTYDAQGNRTTMQNALGHVTRYTDYDAEGRLLRMIDPNGLATSFTYHPRGWLLSRTVGEGLAAVTTRFAYDPAGNLTRITLPDGVHIDLGYDAANRLSTVADGVGNLLRYSLDEMGNRTSEQSTDPQGRVTRVLRRVYDELSRLQQEVGANPARTTDYAYDANGNLTERIDALNRSRTSSYDALDRLIAQLDPAQGQTLLAYDLRDNLTGLTDPRGNTTRYSYNAFDEKIGQSSPDTGTTSYTYDEAGNTISVSDARGVTTNYHYDPLNRLSAIEYPDPDLDVTFTYDQGTYGTGRLTKMQDAGGTTDYAYDLRGNLVRETRTSGSLRLITEYAYDSADRLQTLSYPSGQQVHYGHDGAGRVVSVTLERIDGSLQLLADNLRYLPFGPLHAMDYGNGLELTRTFDQDYRLLRQQIPGVMDTAYSYDGVDNITAWQDGLDSLRDQFFDYDLLDRLYSAQGGYGQLAFSYDALGNRLTAADGLRTQTYLYSPDSNRLEEIQGGLGDLLVYDAAGNVTGTSRGDFHYDDRNRLTGYTAPGVLARYAYNGRGERVMKEVNGAVTHFRYAHGRLIGEYGADGDPIREYVYVQGEPVAMMLAGAGGGSESVERIIDNPEVSLDGAWTRSTSIAGYVGSDYLYCPPGFDTTGQRVVDNSDAGFSTTGNSVWSTSASVSGFSGADYRYLSPHDASAGGETIDDSAATVIRSGQWSPSQAIGGFIGSGYHYHRPGTGANAVTWQLEPRVPGSYRLFARWTSHANRATNAKYLVRHALGETVVTVNQRQDGGEWYLLGTFALDDGSQVVLTDDADGYVIADAVLLDGGEDTRNTATWQIGEQEVQAYRVFARWTSHANRSPKANYLIRHASGETPITVDQRQGGGQWQLLGTFELDAGSRVELTNQGGGHVIADAVMTEPADIPPQPFTASWPLDLPSGDYEVFVRWTSHPNRGSNVAYTVTHQEGDTTQRVDQRQGGGKWHSLGRFRLDGSSKVSVNSDADGYVIADAVRVVGMAKGDHATDIFYTHTDHLGSVAKLTDDTGELAWDAERLPFGDTRLLTEEVEMPLRFPGQYHDEESGLYYNYFRDYDPSTGRYVQSDPIGLEGGLNTYSYVGGNPLRYIDPLGLDYNCGPGYTDISRTTSSGPINCVPNYKPAESACFSSECKMYSPAANSSCLNTCIEKEVAPCVTPSPSPRGWTNGMTGSVSAACVTAATIVCTAKCNKEICDENSGGGNCACK